VIWSKISMTVFDRVLCSCKNCRCGYYGKGSVNQFMCDGCKNGIHGGMRPVTKSVKTH
jgi:hypothetical protein